MSGPEPSLPEFPQAASAKNPFMTEVYQAHPDDASFETDFTELAARFAAKNGGGLPPELSADLALEVVLNEVVEQARLATGATGAAIVLDRDGEMICRATSGVTAPALGSRLDQTWGLSGECVKTHQTQRCDDVVADERADLEASARLGVRSLLIMPLLRGEKLEGVFELFSSRPAAFSERDERTLEVLVSKTLKNLERAARPVAAPASVEETISAEPSAETATVASMLAGAQPVAWPSTELRAGLAAQKEKEYEENSPVIVHEEGPQEQMAQVEEAYPYLAAMPPRPATDTLMWALGAAVLACVLLMGISVGRHMVAGKRTARVHSTASATAQTVTQSVPTTNAGAVPLGGLVVFEDGKEVFRATPPAQAPGKKSEMQKAAAIEREDVVQLSPTAAEDSVVERVEPDYPQAARQQKIQGPVVLDVRIATDGRVQDVSVVSGADPLAQASTEAVKHWRFKPQVKNGRAVEAETRVTLNFRLPG